MSCCVHAAQPPRGNPTHPLAVSGNRIVSAYDGHDIKLAGVNWFGYNVVSVQGVVCALFKHVLTDTEAGGSCRPTGDLCS